ncbi:hypothetical protein [Bergeyella zoohelcum]|uniref:Uncharacterized protein n=1 Tax=Bergeyella zoohelcum TaxID=1015 RepID=A0A376C040_9FLAO|nr:hypothetical protein [Bergeyella zoohelcum]EKB60752.1 hypothetical protein HMPREF9700_00247 [Bergeyella zoohelcum CCUG 30536]SSZ47157.1 Uncharacterised protein [Bergeyella zoohelcum]
MKYPKLSALLGLSEIVLNAGIFGNKKPFAKLDEDDLAKVEEALEDSETESLREELNQSKENLATEKQTVSAVENAVEQALQLAGLTAKETLVENIALLGEKCKEYGDSKNRHSTPENNGTEEPTNGLINGYINPNDAHNQIINSI